MSNELYHYGIQGMKWGVRRYQNEDGSLTPLGKLRYGTPENFHTKYHNSKSTKKITKEVHDMSDKDLKDLKDRLQLEKDVVDLQKKLNEVSSEKTKGQKFVEDIMTDSGKKIATAAVTGAGLYGIAKLLGDESIDVSTTGADIYKSVMKKK